MDERTMLRIDGSFGEGGGQVLRSSLALSMVTGTPFRMEKIRAGRRKPGLMRQHLTAVHAAETVCGAKVEGAEIGSTSLTFEPGTVRPGEYAFSVGTAGSTTLVLQAVLPAFLTASAPSRLTLEGGTHNPLAPPYDFLARAYLPLVGRMGPRVTAHLERHGFFPAGGGRFSVEIEPCPKLEGWTLLERGEIRGCRVRAVVARLPRHIAEREVETIRRRLSLDEKCFQVEEVRDSSGPGNIVTIELESEHVTEVFTAFGKIGRPAETVARDALRQYKRHMKASAPVGEYLSDQVLLPLALAGSGSFRTAGLSQHLRTHIELIAKFLDVPVIAEPTPEGTVVTIGGC